MTVHTLFYTVRTQGDPVMSSIFIFTKVLAFETFTSRRRSKAQNVPDTKMLMRKHVEPFTPLYLITMYHPNKETKLPFDSSSISADGR